MEKTVTMNLRVNPALKQQAEDVLKQLGVPMSTAVDIFLHQIILTGGIPFSVSLPKEPEKINASAITAEQMKGDVDNTEQKRAAIETILHMREKSPLPVNFDWEKAREEAVREKYGRFM